MPSAASVAASTPPPAGRENTSPSAGADEAAGEEEATVGGTADEAADDGGAWVFTAAWEVAEDGWESSVLLAMGCCVGEGTSSRICNNG